LGAHGGGSEAQGVGRLLGAQLQGKHATGHARRPGGIVAIAPRTASRDTTPSSGPGIGGSGSRCRRAPGTGPLRAAAWSRACRSASSSISKKRNRRPSLTTARSFTRRHRITMTGRRGWPPMPRTVYDAVWPCDFLERARRLRCTRPSTCSDDRWPRERCRRSSGERQPVRPWESEPRGERVTALCVLVDTSVARS